MLKYLSVLTCVVTILAVVTGCDDRGTGITRTDLGDLNSTAGVAPDRQNTYTPQLSLQLRNPQESLYGTAYLPPEAIPIPPQDPIPLLVLLAPEGGNKWHYFKAGLEELTKELTASGAIQPMLIYCLGNDQSFGGYFYADSDPAGHHDAIIDDDGTCNTLIGYLHREVPATIQNASKRGIGGIGQGAYGAFRAVIKHPGLFSSISVADGPLDFDGPDNDPNSCPLKLLFDSVLIEQEARYLLDPSIDTVVTGTDTSFNTVPFSYHRDFDSSHTMPISQMFIGGSLAFSPNDTLVDFERRIDTIQVVVVPPSDTVWVTRASFIVHSTARIADESLPGGGDSTTFISDLIRPSDLQTRGFDFDFHLPFDSTGAVYPPIWSRWMANNLDSLYEAAGASPLAGVNIWIGSNPHAKWGYHEMTQSWIDFLRAQADPISIQEYQYCSYTEEPIVEDEYLFDILREMLIFHSDNFGR